MKHGGAAQPGLTLRQEIVEGIVLQSVSGGLTRVVGVQVRGDTLYRAPAVILTTGTFLKALMHMGEAKTRGGRAGDQSAEALSDSLTTCGFELARFKTGTPCRLNGRTIDYSKVEPQPGDSEPRPFSFATERITQSQIDCYITYTSDAVHDVIRANLQRAPMYSGQIQSRGPRYCPSIEDKVVRFADKDKHQIFLEPEGRNTLEVYCSSISTSLPNDVQQAMLRLIQGLENAEVMRRGLCGRVRLRARRNCIRRSRRSWWTAFTSLVRSTAPQDMKRQQRRGLMARINAALKLRANRR